MLVRRDGGFIDLILCDTYWTCLVEAHFIDLRELNFQYSSQRRPNTKYDLGTGLLVVGVALFCGKIAN